MSDEEQQPQTQTQDEVKSEDPNATINIKVCFYVSYMITTRREFG